ENGIKVQIQSDKEENFTWMLFEVSGKLLLKENKEIPQGMSLFELPVNPKLAAGIYLLQAIGETSATAKKILVY
ncbi:MAG TPA: T9SS type A sorting domain-containing protein, partial [Chitinophagales bacterium]|nr:T9SS type A sorting domain-containing protein [Chitinophagales bacterium]